MREQRFQQNAIGLMTMLSNVGERHWHFTIIVLNKGRNFYYRENWGIRVIFLKAEQSSKDCVLSHEV